MKIAEIEELYAAYNEYATAEPHPFVSTIKRGLIATEDGRSVTISRHAYETLAPYYHGNYVTEFSIPDGIKLRTEGLVSPYGGVLLDGDTAELPYDIRTIVRLGDIVSGIVSVGRRIKLKDILGKGDNV